MKRILVLACIVAAILAMIFIGFDITKKEEQRIAINTPRGVPQMPSKSSDWKQFYPNQYESFMHSKDSDKSIDMLDVRPNVTIVRAGESAMGVKWRHNRGKYYSTIDAMFSMNSEFPSDPKNENEYPYAKCIVCHSSDTIRLIERDGRNEFFSRPLAAYGHEAQNPIGCVDCHDPKTTELSVKRDHLNKALVSAGLPVFEKMSHQQKRTFICAQCHMLSFTSRYEWTDTNGAKHIAKDIANPWGNGIGVEEIEAFYDDGANFPDGKPAVHITNMLSKAPTIIGDNTDFEIFVKGTHAKNGVSCADCHLPYTAEGGVKYSYHKISKPLENMDKSCLTCHPGKKEELMQILKDKKSKYDQIGSIALDNLAAANLEAAKAWEAGANAEEMKDVMQYLRKATWRYTYAGTSHGAYFHATEEALRIFADGNNYAMKARIELAKILSAHGAKDYKAPKFKTKEEIYAFLNLPEREALIKKKCEWIDTTGRRWLKEAKENGTLSEDLDFSNTKTWYDSECKK